MPAPSPSSLEHNRRVGFQFSLRWLIFCATATAVLLGLGGRENHRPMLQASGAALCISALTASHSVSCRLTGGLLLTLLPVTMLNVHSFERTFDAYVHDGTPIIGWPRVFATGQSGGGPAPGPLKPPDFLVYSDPYWMSPAELSVDLVFGLAIALAGAMLYSRPRWLAWPAGRSRGMQAIAWGSRGLALCGLTYVLLQHKLLFQAPPPAYVDGTALDYLVLGLIAALFVFPIVFPAHCWSKTGGGVSSASGAKQPAILPQVTTAALAAPALWLLLSKGSYEVGKWQHHYLNLLYTLLLISVAMAVWAAHGSRALPMAARCVNEGRK